MNGKNSINNIKVRCPQAKGVFLLLTILVWAAFPISSVAGVGSIAADTGERVMSPMVVTADTAVRVGRDIWNWITGGDTDEYLNCTATLVEGSVHIGKSAWVFDGSCTSNIGISANYTIQAKWDSAVGQASEWITGSREGGTLLEAGLKSTCSSDPWLNEVACTGVSVMGNFPIHSGTRYPISSVAFPPSKKAEFKALAIHSAPEIQAPAEGYADTDGDFTVLLILKAAPGEVEPDNDPSFWKFNLRFERKEGDSWKVYDILPYLSPSAPNVATNRKVELEPGIWRVQSQTTSPRHPDGVWSQWRNFSVVIKLALDAPSDLKAESYTPFGSAPGIRLIWTDKSENEAGFEIQRKKVGGSSSAFAAVKTVGPNMTTFTDTGLQTDATYVYRVRAVRRPGTGVSSAFSDEASATTVAVAVEKLQGPTGLAARRISANTVLLTWRDNADGELGYKIERKELPAAATGATGGSQLQSTGSTLKKVTPTGGVAPVTLSGGFIPLRTVASNVANFTDTGLKPDATYIYRVKAYRGGTTAMGLMDSDYSNEATAGAQGGTIGTTTSPPKQQLKIKPTVKSGTIQKK